MTAEAGIKVKVCGFKDTNIIGQLDGLSINEVGFILAPSRRQVTPEQAGEMLRAVRMVRNDQGAPIQAVGVVVNASIEELKLILASAPLDVLQLHGQETPEFCAAVKQLGVKVWKVFSLSAEQSAGSTLAGDHLGDVSESELASASALALLAPYKDSIDGALIDTAGGGTGQPFDWSNIPAYREAAHSLGLPLYVAGGLHEGNVKELLGYGPDGVDVSSGVETDGVKDIVKIRAFVERVKRP
ncbi:phosphoribosylanthranilate isomerase [Paenibacillus sp. GCM10012307]|uniref:N-(5'-phosphoribosyl)anthranilate isomerase n=1 Tax=Paenibacillus roseus TaxID=2798579 RepID=A0A934J596_9BACL|nr:phosphoribosylanthranilate isomerase [Paenibacillus roseus]MBJ6363539.1 phosphoribosylanthranilate isomerase [Paenibacillus roseus]